MDTPYPIDHPDDPDAAPPPVDPQLPDVKNDPIPETDAESEPAAGTEP